MTRVRGSLASMLSLLLTILIFVIVGGIVLYAAQLALAAFPIPPRFGKLALAVIVLLLLVLFLSEIGWLGPSHGWRVWR